MNPHLPDIILVGQGEQVPRWARVFATQQEFLPLFAKRGASKWEFLGDYKVKSLSEDIQEIRRHKEYSSRDDIVLILHMERRA